MPPSRHSSSSHSSRSSSSSFRSSSRSSGSSFRSSSSHSSGSSSSRSSFSGGGPSRHSSTSRTSAPAFGAAKSAPGPKDPGWRPRVNQPTGFVAATHTRPTYYYGKRHSYCYYPMDWVDAETGASYRKGYYDENGQRYDSVTFEEGGRYRNVVCHCPYCEQDTILDLSAGDVESHSLQCRNCGGTMEIVSELDTILNEAAPNGNTHVYNSEESLKNAFPGKKKRSKWTTIAIVLLSLGILRSIGDRLLERSEPQIQQISVVENAPVQSSVYLEKQDDGYHVVTDVLRADRILYYDREYDSYYDEESDCWLWYNTDVEPPVWQYWYEGISSDFGDYGWMEHDETGWYIEQSYGSWIPLPEKYDAASLWYIA